MVKIKEKKAFENLLDKLSVGESIDVNTSDIYMHGGSRNYKTVQYMQSSFCFYCDKYMTDHEGYVAGSNQRHKKKHGFDGLRITRVS